MSATAEAADGELVYYVERGAGPPLLLVHGLMVSGQMFDGVAGHFAESHRVVIPDLRGHGRSRALPPPYTAARLAADLARLLDHLGIERTAVLGYSQGGAIAQQFALDFPDRCQRLVLGATYAFNMSSLRERIEGHVAPILLRLLGMRGFARLMIAAGAREFGNADPALLASVIAGQDRRLMTIAWRETMAFDSRPRLAEIACPTLIIAGARDRAVPMHHAHMLHDGIPGSQLVVIEDAAHALLWSRPDAFLQAVDAFLGQGTAPAV